MKLYLFLLFNIHTIPFERNNKCVRLCVYVCYIFVHAKIYDKLSSMLYWKNCEETRSLVRSRHIDKFFPQDMVD